MENNLFLLRISILAVFTCPFVVSDDAALVQLDVGASKESQVVVKQEPGFLANKYTCTLRATGCVGGTSTDVPADWTDAMIWQDYKEYCTLSLPSGGGSAAQRTTCCGSETCTSHSCVTQSVWTLECSDRTPKSFECAWHEIGCTSPITSFIENWASRTDAFVISDMYSYCDLTLQGSGSPEQKIRCCGSSSCTVPACTQLDPVQPGSVHPGLKSDCQAFSCYCNNGEAAVGDACTSQGEHICANCDTAGGYKLTGRFCSLDMSCGDTARGFVNHGDPITGWLKSCPKNLPYNQPHKMCASPECLVDPDRYTCCRQSNCTCQNGVATVGDGTGPTLCENDGAHDCSDCHTGYVLDAVAGLGEQTCISCHCTCPHGTAAVAGGSGNTSCETCGMHDCSACGDGYYISEPAGTGQQTCIENTCTCPNGNPTVANGNGGTLCEQDGNEDCSQCDDYFTLTSPAALGLQTCVCDACSATELPTNTTLYQFSTCTGQVCNGGKCTIGCGDGYQGADVEWTCVNGSLTGVLPTCAWTTTQCNSTQVQAMLTAHTNSDCDTLEKGQTCTAHCGEGYFGTSKSYTCEDDGTFSGEGAMNCTPWPCNASHQPANGNNGTCTDSLPSGSTCRIDCDIGYTRHGADTSCMAGTLVNVSICKPDSCDASEPPNHGSVGDCNSSLPHAAACTPHCDDGYWLEGTTSCNAGRVSPAACVEYCKCELIYEKQCIDQYGYWSEEQQHLDYPGCESFCNQMNLADGITIHGCELEAVAGADRTLKGSWCFAHANPCDYGDALPNNAAAKCVHFTSQGY